MTLTPETLATDTLENVAANLISSAIVRCGIRVQTFLSNDKTNNEAASLLASSLTNREGEQAASLASLVPLVPNGSTATRMKQALGTYAIQTCAQQFAAALLTGRPDCRREYVQAMSNELAAIDGGTAGQYESLASAVGTAIEQAVTASMRSLEASERLPYETLARVILLQKSADSLARADVSPRVSAELRRSWEDRYRSLCSLEHGYTTPPDYRERNKVLSEELYVPARLRSLGQDERHVSHRTVLDLVPNLDRNVLLGNPGGGKSTASEMIASTLSRSPGERIPFLVVLRDFASKQSQLSIVDYIENNLNVLYQSPAPPGLVQQLLDEGSALVIFDGLDELLDTAGRLDITRRVENFGNSYPAVPILVTSREVGYKEAQLDVRTYKVDVISDFTEPDVQQYVSKWFALQDYPAEDAAALASSFMEDSESVLDLRSNPLLLALMCIIYRGQRYLPKNRTGVYEECSRLLFETWDKSRGIEVQIDFELHLEAALKHLAYWMFKGAAAKGGVSRTKLVDEVSSFLEGRVYESEFEARSAASSFVDFCKGRAWVLSDAGSTGQGEPLYKFTHQTFMEYFAASHLTRMHGKPRKLAKTLAPRVAKAEWDVVGQLAIHLENQRVERGGEKIIEHLMSFAASLPLQQRENVLDFCARSVEYLGVPPALLRKLCRDVINSIRLQLQQSQRQIRFDSVESWRTLSAIDQANIKVVFDEFSIITQALLSSPHLVDQTIALHLLTELGSGGFRGHISASRLDAWREFSQQTLVAQSQAILRLPVISQYWVQQLLYRGVISFEDWYDVSSESGDLILDALFRQPSHPVYAGTTLVSAASLMLEWRLWEGSRLIPSLLAQGAIILSGISALLSGSSPKAHIVSADSLTDTFLDREAGGTVDAERELAAADAQSLFIVFLILAERAGGTGSIPANYEGPGSRSSLMSIGRSVNASGQPVGSLAALITSRNGTAATLIADWYESGRTLVKGSTGQIAHDGNASQH